MQTDFARGATLVTFVALCLPALAQDGSPGDLGAVVEEVVAAVGPRVITRSDLELETRVVLINGGGTEAAFAALEAETVRSAFNWLLNQMVIVAEAERLQVFEVTPEQAAQDASAFARRFGDAKRYAAFLEAQDVTQERILGIFRRNLRVKRYLDSRVKLTVRVSEDEVAVFYADNIPRFSGRPLSEVAEVIRGYLFKQRYEDTVRRLVAELRAKARLRVVVEPGAMAAVGE